MIIPLKNGDWNCVRCGAPLGVAFCAAGISVNQPENCPTRERCRQEMIDLALFGFASNTCLDKSISDA